MTRSGRPPVRPAERGQATVELALALPAVLLVLLLLLQVAVLVRDEVTVVHAARAGARAAAVAPDVGAAAAAAATVGGVATTARVHLDGSTSVGGLLGVTVEAVPTRLPVVGRLAAGVRLRERLVVRVEGPP